jgi:hypothetical protein
MANAWADKALGDTERNLVAEYNLPEQYAQICAAHLREVIDQCERNSVWYATDFHPRDPQFLEEEEIREAITE